MKFTHLLLVLLVIFSCSEDSSGNTDGPGTTPDTEKPAAPTNLSIAVDSTKITLSWDANTEADLKTYTVYGGTSSSPTTKLSTTSSVSYAIADLLPNTTYYYRITATDTANNESDFSNEKHAKTDQQDYAILLKNSWSAFERGDFSVATDSFKIVIESEPNKLEAYTAVVFSELLQNKVDEALSYSEKGDGKTGNDTTHMLAWAYALNAKGVLSQQSTYYTQSNAKISGSKVNDAWEFGHKLNLVTIDIWSVEARNHFALANYAEALTSLKKVFGSFELDHPIDSPEGLAELAEAIEELNTSLNLGSGDD